MKNPLAPGNGKEQKLLKCVHVDRKTQIIPVARGHWTRRLNSFQLHVDCTTQIIPIARGQEDSNHPNSTGTRIKNPFNTQ